MRGRTALYDNFLLKPELKDEHPSGKRTTYTEERDEALVCRYYYYASLCRKNFQDIMDNLTSEFFIGQDYIVRLIWSKKMDRLLELRDLDTSSSDLKQLYPHFSWKVAC